MCPSYPAPPIRRSAFCLYNGVQIIKTKSAAVIDCSMNCGSRSPEDTSYWSTVTSTPSESNLSENFLTHSLCCSLSHEYVMKILGTSLMKASSCHIILNIVEFEKQLHILLCFYQHITFALKCQIIFWRKKCTRSNERVHSHNYGNKLVWWTGGSSRMCVFIMVLPAYISYLIPLAAAISSAASFFAWTTTSSILLSPFTSISW